MRGTMVKLNNMNRWIEFKYEKCLDCCFRYGIIGHIERNCSKGKDSVAREQSNQFGVCLKANKVRSPQISIGMKHADEVTILTKDTPNRSKKTTMSFEGGAGVGKIGRTRSGR
ncbi:hypothetical protein ACH5RR_039248 [Cinchona calisaya]|uniref:CCHC-type domain-containing protein n=1 Tax=Cinchona calisaya TaxID=153742 RepID=A0ABD2Y2Y1_9GENT